jgi:3-methyladenine DNA glycosylase AlkD
MKRGAINMNYQTAFETYCLAADSNNAIKMSKYMRDLFPFLGIPTPKRRELSKEFLNHTKNDATIDWIFIDECWKKEREFQYLALDYLNVHTKRLTPDDIPRLKKLATTKSWWDTIDCLDRIIGGIALNFPEVNDILLEWSTDDNFWLRRIAIDHQLLRKEKTNTALLEQIIVNNLGQTEFFINKAIGWSLREYSKTSPDWVREFLARYKDKMANLSIREASTYV